MKRISKVNNRHKTGSDEAGLAVLNIAGARVTSQRALLLELMRRGGGHLGADELYRQARERQPRLSLSTVYRTLRMFKKLDLVEELHFDESHHHYEVKAPDEHHHLMCLDCGRVIEFQYSLSHYIKRHVPDAKDFDITETEVRMAGYCSECHQSQK